MSRDIGETDVNDEDLLWHMRVGDVRLMVGGLGCYAQCFVSFFAVNNGDKE